MLQSLKKIYGDKLGATDGEIGHVKDFYFDDQELGGSLCGRGHRFLVAGAPGAHLSPCLRQPLDRQRKVLRVNLTRKQIENSPSIESHKPVSRQYEEEYYRYYGWPFYWQGDALWGMSDFPIVELPSNPLPTEQAMASGQGPNAPMPICAVRKP